MVVQNGSQKWNEHDEISKVANFETAVAYIIEVFFIENTVYFMGILPGPRELSVLERCPQGEVRLYLYMYLATNYLSRSQNVEED